MLSARHLALRIPPNGHFHQPTANECNFPCAAFKNVSKNRPKRTKWVQKVQWNTLSSKLGFHKIFVDCNEHAKRSTTTLTLVQSSSSCLQLQPSEFSAAEHSKHHESWVLVHVHDTRSTCSRHQLGHGGGRESSGCWF